MPDGLSGYSFVVLVKMSAQYSRILYTSKHTSWNRDNPDRDNDRNAFLITLTTLEMMHSRHIPRCNILRCDILRCDISRCNISRCDIPRCNIWCWDISRCNISRCKSTWWHRLLDKDYSPARFRSLAIVNGRKG